MRKLILLPAALLLLLLAMPGCRILNPSIMLQTPKDYVYDTLKMDSAAYNAQEYRIAPNDLIEFRLYANDGFTLINLTTLNNRDNIIQNQNLFQYQVNNYGMAKLPIIGDISLSGYTLRQAEDTLEARYSQYYVDPYSMLRVVNKRVIVYPGNDGAAKVVTLANNNTTLLEALALTGGIPESGKAYDIKLIRNNGNPANPDVYHMNLSKIEGIAQANIIVQANDIIYVEPRKYYARETLREITPILSLVTSAFLLITLFTR